MSAVMTPKPRNLVLNLLLGAGGEALSARTAVAACALFGIRENSVRVALVRLAAAGLVEAAGRGTYRLGPSAAQLASDVATWRRAGERVRDWDGGWIAVHSGPLGRSDRSALRARSRAMDLLGLRELERGLSLRPDNLVGGVATARERLFRLGLESGAAVFRASELDAGRDRRARLLWDGDALSQGYRETRRRLVDWLDHAPALELEVAAREAFLLGHDAIRQLIFDPLLPAPLVDTDARREFIDAVVRFDGAGQAIWKRFREETMP